MRLFIPANGKTKKLKFAKSGERRRRRKQAREANARTIDQMIEDRRNKGLGMRT